MALAIVGAVLAIIAGAWFNLNAQLDRALDEAFNHRSAPDA